MKPVEFTEQTLVLSANPNQLEIDGQEVGKLPIFTDGNQVVSCWGLSFRERLQALWFGKGWVGVHSGRTQPPDWERVDKTVG